jgi:hypothetical protein
MRKAIPRHRNTSTPPSAPVSPDREATEARRDVRGDFGCLFLLYPAIPCSQATEGEARGEFKKAKGCRYPQDMP